MIATINADHATRARAIFAAGLLSKPIVIDPGDAHEWQRLEDERASLFADDGTLYRPIDSGVKYSNTPHPKSAYADLPMRGICASKSSTRTNRDGVGGVYVEVNAAAQKRSAIALWPEPKRAKFRSPVSGKVVKDAKVLIKKDAPHPQSAYSHLPLSGLGLKGGDPTRKWTLNAEEKRTLASRPIRYSTAR